MSLSHVQLFVTHGLHSPWNSLGQNTGVGSHSLLQGIFPTQGSNPGLPYCRKIPYQLSHQGSQLKMTEGQLSEQIQACLSSSGFTINIKAIGFLIRIPFLSIQSVISLLFEILLYSAFYVPEAKFAEIIFI